jgi:hypothetical protein
MMNENFKWIAAAVAVVGLSIGAVVYFTQGNTSEAPPKPAAVAEKPAEPEEPPVEHPLAAADTNQALPALNDSDLPIEMELEDLIGRESVGKYLVATDMVRHIVVTIDNLPNAKVAERLRPVKPAPGRFVTSGSEDALLLDPANYERYQPLVQLFRSADSQQLVAIYTRYYPLFQEAYENLGHPPKYFNDRVIQVIDHLLATPDVKGPISLAQPNMQFEYADPRIEALSAGQKALIRMGSENTAAVKQKLKELRRELVARQAAK